MTPTSSKAPLYPKSHILAASGVAALLSLALLVFPTREVEAKRTFIELDLPPTSELSSTATPNQPAPPSIATAEKPFPEIPGQTDLGQSATTLAVEAETPSRDKVITVSSGDTLSTIFAQAGLPSSAVHEALSSSKEAKSLARLKIGQQIEIRLDESGNLERLRSQISDLETVQLIRHEGKYRFEKEKLKPSTQQAYAYGRIDSSLFIAAKRAGLSHNLTMELANIFGYDIDFALDIRKGDTFEAVYEEQIIEGKRVGTGNILAARFTNKGKTYTAVRYTNKDGSTSYYTATGESMRKAFIRTPVDFARISSRFSNGRKHPILNKIRAHKGVDYAAPRGTPIKSTGDGKVLLAGRKGGYGNTVVIQHGNRYRTLYAHMQGFAKGIRNGSRVKQGQIIGYIGTTGLSTGPHLHYEFQVDGVHVDPLGLKLPMADPLAKQEKQRFLKISQPLMAFLDKEKATMLALSKP
ncbi:peptidoglycan DD-metalloendopeptidase family protein [Stutzerimonas urumqiensis]|uniref:peptidoglycan DD-metalloendopeptidase family protein n=1 Tax=Stutzerimonas urumqiensis TaxID=638269 RepID=UPI003DA41555